MATKRPEDHVHLRRNSRSYNVRSSAAQMADDIELTTHNIRAREHRGGFEESMETSCVIPGSIEGIEAWIAKVRPEIDSEIVRANLTIDTTFSNDIRNGWLWTRTVSVEGHGPVGYIDWKTPKLKRKGT